MLQVWPENAPTGIAPAPPWHSSEDSPRPAHSPRAHPCPCSSSVGRPPAPSPPSISLYLLVRPPPRLPYTPQLRGGSSTLALGQGPLSSWLLPDPEPRFVCPHPNMWCAGGSRGRGSKWLPRWLVASPPLSSSVSPSSLCSPCSFSCCGVTSARGLDGAGTGVGSSEGACALWPVDRDAVCGEALLSARLRRPRGRRELVTRPSPFPRDSLGAPCPPPALLGLLPCTGHWGVGGPHRGSPSLILSICPRPGAEDSAWA